MGCRSRCWIGLALLMGLAAGGCSGDSTASPPSSSPPKVTVVHPTFRKVVDEDEYTGWLDATETVDVRARVRGHIDAVHFNDGDVVKQDQLLFELDRRPFEAAVSEARAQARAVEAQKIAAERDVARYAELLKSRAVSQQEYDKIAADAISYAAQQAAKLQEVAVRQLDLEYSRIRAPIGGRIGRALLTKGNLVNAGGTDPILATIVSVDPIYVYFTVDERSLQRYQKARRPVEPSQPQPSVRELKIPIRFALDTDQGFPHEGALDFGDNRVDPTTGTIQIRGVVANDHRIFVPGSRVRVRVPVSEPFEATLVPDEAVNADQDRRYLLLVDDQKVVKRCNVRLGRLLDDGLRVVEKAEPPLSAESWIIVEGMQRARLNYPVDPISQ